MAILPLPSESVFTGGGCDLHVIIKHIVDMQAAVAPGDVEAFRMKRRAHARLVPVRHRVADMVDYGLRARLDAGTAARNDAGIARDQERAALALLWPEHHVGPLAVIAR